MTFSSPITVTERKVAERAAWRSRIFWVAFLAILLVLTKGAWAQDNATITGTVSDASGAVVPNAEISLTNPATGQVRKAVSNNVGSYHFTNVGVGTYTISTSVPGFQNYSVTGVVVNVAATREENISLKVGGQGQTVTVVADSLQVQTETSAVTTLMSGEQVSQLATNGRNVTSLAALGLGVSNTLPAFGGVNALTSANGISFNGTRPTHNIYMLDGGEQNDRGCGGCFMNLPSQDALAQFQTLDSNYSPDYGIGSGGTILMVLKSGTSKFHGALFWFNRNTVYNANDYFVKAAGQERPLFQLNEPGGNIGGPVFIPHVYNENRTRTFFFWSEEWRRLNQGSSPSVVNTIPANNFPTPGQDLHYTVAAGKKAPVYPSTYNVPVALQGKPFPVNPDGTYTIPLDLMDPNAVLQVNAGTFPKPNLNTSQYISSIPQPTHVRDDIVRIDHAINSKLQLMGHYLHDAVTQSYYPPLWGNSTYPTVGTAMTNPSYSATIKLTQTYSPTLLNETAFLYSGNKITLDPIDGPGGTFVQPAGWTATSFFPVANNIGARLPEIRLQGSPLNVNWSPSYYPWKNGYEGFQYKDDVSWTHGRHQFKFGFSWLHTYKNQQLQANTQGTAVFDSSNFSGDSYVNFLLGDTTSFTQLEFLAGKHWVNNNYSFYGLDNWRVTPNLTLNLGLRFDGLPHAFERYNQFANFVPADYDPALGNPVTAAGTLNPAALTDYNGTPFYLNGIRLAGVDGFPRGVVEDTYRTWQPRVGFAYNISGNGKSVLRGGVGFFYERVQGNDVYNAALNPPFAYQPSATNVAFSNPNTSVLTGQTTTQAFPSALTNIKYRYPPPGTVNYSLGVQQELAPSVVAVLQYVGSTGWDQNNGRQINTLPLTNPNNPANPYDLRQGVATGKLNANLYRIFPGYSNINQEENETNFNYNGLQAGIRLENWHSLTAQVAYTWSHEIDVVSNDLNGLSNPFDAAYDRGSGAFDRRNIFNATYIYAFPWYKNSSNRAARWFLAGWQFSGVTVAEGGTPLRINYTGSDVLGLGGGTNNRPNQVAAITYPKTVKKWFSTESFADPVAPWNGGPNNGFGNARKDAVRIGGLFNFNLSLFKNIQMTESQSLQLRFESFNTFNHTQFQNFDAGSHDSNFGQVVNDYGPRVLQLGAKYQF